MHTKTQVLPLKYRSILFSTPMVLAIKQGRKTMTRRVIKWPTNYDVNHLVVDVLANSSDSRLLKKCPYGVTGDRLRVKEAAWMWCERQPNGLTKTGREKWHYVPMRGAPIHYAADHPAKPEVSISSPHTGNQWGWRLKIGRFLPLWASRITLEIVNIRLERLREISEADALAEGVIQEKISNDVVRTAYSEFKNVWCRINGGDSWDGNPWVWVISFKQIENS
jgi:hypothetical protein